MELLQLGERVYAAERIEQKRVRRVREDTELLIPARE